MEIWFVEFFISIGLWDRDRSLKREITPDKGPYEVIKRIVRWTLIELLFYAILIASYLWLILSFIWDCLGAEEQWFQRSGAIVVAAALISEFFRFSDNRARAHSSHFVKVSKRFIRVRHIMENFGFISIVLGTIVWAYGDLLM